MNRNQYIKEFKDAYVFISNIHNSDHGKNTAHELVKHLNYFSVAIKIVKKYEIPSKGAKAVFYNAMTALINHPEIEDEFLGELEKKVNRIRN